jgi:hypothetical protein
VPVIEVKPLEATEEMEDSAELASLEIEEWTELAPLTAEEIALPTSEVMELMTLVCP